MGRLMGSFPTACCFQLCVGMDALNALSITTHAADLKYGAEDNKRFLKFLARAGYVQENDLVCYGVMTDTRVTGRCLPTVRPIRTCSFMW